MGNDAQQFADLLARGFFKCLLASVYGKELFRQYQHIANSVVSGRSKPTFHDERSGGLGAHFPRRCDV